MYEEILSTSYDDAKRRFSDNKDNSNVAKIITLNNKGQIGAYSNDSEVLVFYDVISGEPLTLVERLDKVDVILSDLNRKIEDFNSNTEDYVASIQESGEYYDVTVVHRNLTLC